MKLFFILVLTFNVFSQRFTDSIEGKSFDEIAIEIGKQFPVLYKTTYELKGKVQNYLVLDARTKKEFEVSHISEARFIGFDEFDYEKTKTLLDTDKPILVYCGLGYRSAVIADKLIKKGHRVFKLYGGIFDWFNRGGELVDSKARSTQHIHGFNEKWSKLIKRGKIVLD